MLPLLQDITMVLGNNAKAHCGEPLQQLSPKICTSSKGFDMRHCMAGINAVNEATLVCKGKKNAAALE